LAYTETDLENIEQAIIDFSLGNRSKRTTIGNHTVEFQDISLDDLLNLKAIIEADLNPNYSPRSYAKNGGRG